MGLGSTPWGQRTGLVELSTEIAARAKPVPLGILERTHDFRFGGIAAAGDNLLFRHTVRLGDFTTDDFHDFLSLVATYGHILQAEFGDLQQT